jgi:hypothetical protein
MCFFSGNVILHIDVHMEELTARYLKELFNFLGKNMFMVIKARHLFTYQRSTVKTKEQAFSDRIGHIALFHGNALNFTSTLQYCKIHCVSAWAKWPRLGTTEGVSPLSRQAMRKWRETSANGDG